MGLGSLWSADLTTARRRAVECARLVYAGIDPIDHRRGERTHTRINRPKSITFDAASATYFRAHQASWKSDKHRDQWRNSIKAYASPVLGLVPVHDINTALVLRALQPIWREKPETAGRVRTRIEAVLNWSTAMGHRKGDNPARWKGHLDKLLPPRTKIQRVIHFAALPYAGTADLMIKLRNEPTQAAAALRLLILTATRTNEILGAVWDEFNLNDCMWVIPAERMKGSREHRIPLSVPALMLLEAQRGRTTGRYVFMGDRGGDRLGDMALLGVFKRIGLRNVTAHGFRSTFRDWAAEETSHQPDTVEMALAHAIPNKVEAAYRRGDLLQKRRRLMNDWAEYCMSGAILPLVEDGMTLLSKFDDVDQREEPVRSRSICS